MLNKKIGEAKSLYVIGEFFFNVAIAAKYLNLLIITKIKNRSLFYA